MKTYKLIGKTFVIALIAFAAVTAASAKDKKFGLFVGINAYQGGISPLKGCVNDATKMRDAMVGRFGFKTPDTTLLLDAAATREAILTNLNNIAAQATVGDLVVFHYSGHGTLFPDKYSEEQDETKLIYMEAPNREGVMQVIYERGTYDSALVPVDARSTTSGKPWRNLILDDELYAILGGITRKGAQVVLISDSCHSGSIDRAGLKSDAKYKDPQARTQGLATVFGARRFADLKFDEPAQTRAASLPPVKGLYIAMTGSRDDEFSLDVTIGGVPSGLFTA
ncbi:MAG TPA: caspase family protein, partial [Pyrinomonadaceae bacterium]|nr:caspase family protein [Pyrinomonadaceae bacterium]